MVNYVLTSKVHSEIYNFYINVSKKYSNTYDYNDMSRDINRTCQIFIVYLQTN